MQNTTKESVTEKRKEHVLLSIDEVGFLDNGTGKHQSNMVYNPRGICPCEYAGQYKTPLKILV